ncbi:MAG: 2-oxoacid:ferredoxin oxidoreductase subunit beta [Rhodothermaceae bacterium]
MENNIETKLTHKDFIPAAEVKWCPGCGDYVVLNQVQKIMPEIGRKKEDIVWVSGIGCSSRFPYYMDTYGFHSIHGRAPAIATGLKVARPELSVWVATGDGDLMSIGGNHFIHTCRKNVDLKIILFNNQIYGLTKGQYSPTSEKGKVTKTTPYGSIDNPFNPSALALGAGATFIARAIDRNPKMVNKMLKAAAEHKGTAFVEVYQNCVIFNDGAFDAISTAPDKLEKIINLEDQQPLIFGKEKDKGIILDGFNPKVVSLTDGKYSADDLLVHDEHDESPVRAQILSLMTEDENLPTPFGIFRKVDKPVYDTEVHNQMLDVTEKKGKGSIKDLLYTPNTWEVK